MIILSCPVQHLEDTLPDLPIDSLIEYRLDPITDLQSIPWNHFHAKHILTYRNTGELSIIDYLAMIDTCYELTPSIIDIDYRAWCSSGKRPLGERFILSLHQEVLDSIELESLLRETTPLGNVKIAINASSWDEILAVHSQIVRSGRKDTIFSVMGKYGKLQRIIHQALGSAAVFVYHDLPTASGQLSLEEAILFNCMFINSQTQIYGILGDKSVNQSKSLQRYNQRFRQDSRNAVYLPIPAKDMPEAYNILSWLRSRYTVIGLSITMPYKKQFPEFYGKSFIANTFLLASQKFYNTDVIAFAWSLQELQISPQASILIYGYGACAELFIRYLKANGYNAIRVSGKSPTRVQELCGRLEVEEYSYTRTPVDLMVNCSPLGKALDDDLHNLPPFLHLIDLAYNETVTQLVHLAQAQQLPYIDGHTFWEQQFSAQYSLLTH